MKQKAQVILPKQDETASLEFCENDDAGGNHATLRLSLNPMWLYEQTRLSLLSSSSALIKTQRETEERREGPCLVSETQ